NSATLTVLTNTSATSLTSLANCPGTTATFSTTPSGTGPFSYVWLKDGNLQSGQTSSSLSVGPVTASDAATYSVTVSGACGSVTNSATLTVLTSVNATSLTAATNCPGTSVTFSTIASGTGPFSYLWRKDGNPLGGATNNTFSIPSVTAS